MIPQVTRRAVLAALATPALAGLLDYCPEDAQAKLLMLAEKGQLTPQAIAQFESALGMAEQARAGYKMRGYFPDTGPYRRELYAKHMAFIAAGATYRERCFMAANRIGKTSLGAYETTCHVTGLYPDWWNGKRFGHPVEAWVCGNTTGTVRDIVQEQLLGDLRDQSKFGTGMLPRHTIGHITRKGHTADAVDRVWVRHVTGGQSLIGFKSYEEGRSGFEGTAKHLIWLDEEPEQDAYTECLLRTMTTNGIIIATFTPLRGRTPLVSAFLAAQHHPAESVRTDGLRRDA